MSNISYSVSVFQELIQKYPLFESLKEYLESENGGLLKFTDFQNDMCIIKYEKGVSKFDIPYVKWFRSVVWNIKTNTPISIAPPKSSNSELPYVTLNDALRAGIVCEEFLDGFMINCFKVINDDTNYYSTRSKLGATGNYYSSKTFKELFNESFAYSRIGKSIEINDRITNDFVSYDIVSPVYDLNEVARFYSYLVQHPEHRVVTPIDENGYKVYDILSGIVYNDGSVKIMDGVFSKPSSLPLTEIPKICLKTESNSEKSESESNSEKSESVQEFIQSLISEKDWKFQGIVFKDSNGNRWKFRSDKYMAVKSLRGNTNYPSQRFAQLFEQNLIKQYLEYYPEEATILTICNMYLITIIIHIHELYCKVHITKSVGIDDVNKIYHPHLYTLHGIYLSKLRNESKKVTLNDVYDYIHKLPWQRTQFLIDNYLICNV